MSRFLLLMIFLSTFAFSAQLKNVEPLINGKEYQYSMEPSIDPDAKSYTFTMKAPGKILVVTRAKGDCFKNIFIYKGNDLRKAVISDVSCQYVKKFTLPAGKYTAMMYAKNASDSFFTIYSPKISNEIETSVGSISNPIELAGGEQAKTMSYDIGMSFYTFEMKEPGKLTHVCNDNFGGTFHILDQNFDYPKFMGFPLSEAMTPKGKYLYFYTHSPGGRLKEDIPCSVYSSKMQKIDTTPGSIGNPINILFDTKYTPSDKPMHRFYYMTKEQIGSNYFGAGPNCINCGLNRGVVNMSKITGNSHDEGSYMMFKAGGKDFTVKPWGKY